MPANAMPQHAPVADTSSNDRARVLVVEDEFLVSMELETALMDEGFEVVGIANSADQAIHLATTFRPDLVIMDIRLIGQRDGIDAAKKTEKAGDLTGMAAQVSDDHVAAFSTESTWDTLADKLIEKYAGTATRLVFYNAVGDPERFERYGEVARRISARSAAA